MKLAFACPYYGTTPPLVGDSQRANVMNAATEAGHQWIDDYSVSGTQHRNACEAMAFKAAHDKRVDAVFWTEHDVILPPMAVVQLCETLEKTPEADMVTGITFRRSEPYNPMVAMLDNSLTPERYEEMKTSPEYNVRRATTLMSFEEMKSKMLMSIHTVDTSAPPFPADTASMCAVLFRREVFEKTVDIPDLFAIDQHGFFSIDNAFFMRLRDLGLKLYCDPRVLCGHLGDPKIVDWNTWREHGIKQMERLDLKRQEKLRAGGETSRIYGELTRLANKHRTDKGTLDHTPDSGWQGWVNNYCDFYESLLDPMRLTAKKVLEIGVWHGASLKMWRDYFPNAHIYGLDVDDCTRYDEERVTTIVGDQANRTDLLRVIWKEIHPPLDLIVDDGGHTMEQQQVSLGALFQHVKPGGWYILEDLHTSFLPGTDYGVEEGGANATIKVVAALSEGRPVESRYMTPEEAVYLTSLVERCIIYGKKSITAMIQKKRA